MDGILVQALLFVCGKNAGELVMDLWILSRDNCACLVAGRWNNCWIYFYILGSAGMDADY